MGRALLTWLGIILAETVHGVLRGLLLVPVVGDLRARQIGVAIGSAIIVGIAWMAVRWIGRRPASGWLWIGGLWTVLTLAFEVTLGRALGLSWDRILSDYDLSRGGFMLFGVLVLVFAPYWAARRRGVAG